MTKTFKAACVQNCAGPDMTTNLTRSVEMIKKARDMGADMIALPEYFSYLDVDDLGLQTGSQPEETHPGLAVMCEAARETGAWLLAGSFAVDGGSDGRSRNRSYMIEPDGTINARYDKIHMFDVELGKGESFKESDNFEPGTDAVLAQTPWGALGMTVCYDLRFAYLYRSLAQSGARFLSVPAAFMRTTGMAHWHVLLRARAIETGCFVIAPCQNGSHGRANTYGHSLIVDPWGNVLADGSGEDEDIIIAEIDPSLVDEARGKVPALEHDRPYGGTYGGPHDEA
ncbi:MAG: carbon-nitrogen hydrolase family protein [Rhodospirillales bacterium]|jgi:deaminated glutathione amidase|nr:carbon-nitrogen hydrolase family protein [Rhodospirillales bacterium]